MMRSRLSAAALLAEALVTSGLPASTLRRAQVADDEPEPCRPPTPRPQPVAHAETRAKARRLRQMQRNAAKQQEPKR